MRSAMQAVTLVDTVYLLRLVLVHKRAHRSVDFHCGGDRMYQVDAMLCSSVCAWVTDRQQDVIRGRANERVD